MKPSSETMSPPTYERPEVEDYGTLIELTLGNKNAPAADQIIGEIPAAFSGQAG